MASSLFHRLSKRGAFVLVIPPRLEFATGEPWYTVVPRSIQRRNGSALRRAEQAVSNVFLPSCLGGLRFLPQTLVAELEKKTKRWVSAYSKVRQTVEGRDPAMLEVVVAEKSTELFNSRRRSNRPSYSSGKQIEEHLTRLFETEFLAAAPSVSPVQLSSRQLRGLSQPIRCSLPDAVASFVFRSHTDTIRHIFSIFDNLVDWASVFEHCTDKVYKLRCYYRKRLRSLPVDRWIAWLEALEDKPVVGIIRYLERQLPASNPGRRKAAAICRCIAAKAVDLEDAKFRGTLKPGILRSANAVL